MKINNVMASILLIATLIQITPALGMNGKTAWDRSVKDWSVSDFIKWRASGDGRDLEEDAKVIKAFKRKVNYDSQKLSSDEAILTEINYYVKESRSVRSEFDWMSGCNGYLLKTKTNDNNNHNSSQGMQEIFNNSTFTENNNDNDNDIELKTLENLGNDSNKYNNKLGDIQQTPQNVIINVETEKDDSNNNTNKGEKEIFKQQKSTPQPKPKKSTHSPDSRMSTTTKIVAIVSVAAAVGGISYVAYNGRYYWNKFFGQPHNNKKQ